MMYVASKQLYSQQVRLDLSIYVCMSAIIPNAKTPRVADAWRRYVLAWRNVRI